jgi:hypothetical protein
MTLKRDGGIKLVEEDYFGNVARSNIDAILNFFTDDSLINIRHGDMHLRSFSKNPSASETALDGFYAHICGNFNAWAGNFVAGVLIIRIINLTLIEHQYKNYATT